MFSESMSDKFKSRFKKKTVNISDEYSQAVKQTHSRKDVC